mmetsp:Transcript_10180/g.35280  ORF Transcript_10180/g.35280 Transcript_10180/m.35280 type:complete len:201 (-) Transcript_10180:138-740(-)
MRARPWAVRHRAPCRTCSSQALQPTPARVAASARAFGEASTTTAHRARLSTCTRHDFLTHRRRAAAALSSKEASTDWSRACLRQAWTTPMASITAFNLANRGGIVATPFESPEHPFESSEDHALHPLKESPSPSPLRPKARYRPARPAGALLANCFQMRSKATPKNCTTDRPALKSSPSFTKESAPRSQSSRTPTTSPGP